MAALQSALSQKSKESLVKPETVTNISSNNYMAPSRIGKTNLTAYLSKDYKRNMRLIQAKTGKSLQSLIAEALNDLFEKYDVPTIDGE